MKHLQKSPFLGWDPQPQSTQPLAPLWVLVPRGRAGTQAPLVTPTLMLAPTSLLRLNLLLRLLQDAFDGVVGAGLWCPDPRRDATWSKRQDNSFVTGAGFTSSTCMSGSIYCSSCSVIFRDAGLKTNVTPD